MDVEGVVRRLAGLPNVVAIALGGSRATGRHRPDSDWDLGIYFRHCFEVDRLRALGFEGRVVDPGAWGRLVNGGAWLTVEGERVDLLYRDLDFVRHWTLEAEAGRFEVDRVFGYVAGMPTYTLAGELAECRVLHGELPRPAYPGPLQRVAPPRWRALRDFSLDVAGSRVDVSDLTMFVGLCSTAIIAEAHARLAESGQWVLNEKAIAKRADLLQAEEALVGMDATASSLRSRMDRLRQALVASPC